MSLLHLDLKEMEGKLKKDIAKYRDAALDVKKDTAQLEHDENQYVNAFRTLTPATFMSKMKLLREAAKTFAKVLKRINSDLGDHADKAQVVRMITEWDTIVKILEDEDELRKMNQEKLVAQLKSDFEKMVAEAKLIHQHLEDTKGELFSLWRNAANA